MSSRSHDLASQLRHARTRTADELAVTLRRFAEPLPEPRDDEFGPVFDRFGDAQIVLLGEATHGSSEFYVARAAITRQLIEQHGFSIVAVETDWPDAAHVDAYVRGLPPRPARTPPFLRFPQWMWRNEEFADFVDWLHTYNRDLKQDARVAFRGLDIYSLHESIATVLEYLDGRDLQKAAEARKRYGCLTPWQEDPAGYGRAVVRGADDCEEEVIAQLRDLLQQRLTDLHKDSEAFLDAVQNARVVRSAEHYYRSMYRGTEDTWNIRDRHMFDTLQALLRAGVRGAPEGTRAPKAVVWAHNSHVGDASATAMGWRGEFNIGELCRKAYGGRAVAIGFGTDRGTVAAASDWGGPVQIMSVHPARSDSYEHAFREAARPRSLTDWRVAENAELTEQLSQSLLERAIGVIYRPETELESHYFESVLSDQFDAWVWLEETTAVSALRPRPSEGGEPDTYPFAL